MKKQLTIFIAICLLSIFSISFISASSIEINPETGSYSNPHWELIKYDGIEKEYFNTSLIQDKLSATICITPTKEVLINSKIYQDSIPIIKNNNLAVSINPEIKSKSNILESICLTILNKEANYIQFGKSSIVFSYVPNSTTTQGYWCSDTANPPASLLCNTNSTPLSSAQLNTLSAEDGAALGANFAPSKISGQIVCMYAGDKNDFSELNISAKGTGIHNTAPPSYNYTLRAYNWSSSKWVRLSSVSSSALTWTSGLANPTDFINASGYVCVLGHSNIGNTIIAAGTTDIFRIKLTTSPVINITDCRDLTYENTTWILNNSIIYSENADDCIRISANNTILNMNGKNLTASSDEWVVSYGITCGTTDDWSAPLFYNITIFNGSLYDDYSLIRYNIQTNCSGLNISNLYANYLISITDYTLNMNNIFSPYINLYYVSNSSFTNITAGESTQYYGENNKFINSSFGNIYLYDDFNITFLNSTVNFEFVDATSQLIRSWYYRAYVNDTAGNNVSNANVTAYNVSNSYQFNLTTDATGFTPITEIIDYINNAGIKTYYSNYSIYAIDNLGHRASHSLNITSVQSYQDKFQLSCWIWLNQLFDYPATCGSDIDSALKEIFV